MKNSKDLFQDLRKQITLIEDTDELDSMVYLLLEDLVGISRSDILFEHESPLSVEQKNLVLDAVKRENAGEPIQYISGKAHFYGCVYQVNPSVLIPRPETEELVREAIKKSDLGMGKAGLDGVSVFNPQGTLIGRIDLPERCANLCFGGRHRNRLLMCGSTSMFLLFVNTQGA